MAKRNKRITDPTDAASEARVDLGVRGAALLLAFLVLAIVSVFTVMIPELRDDGSEDEADAAGASTSAETAASPSASAHTP